MQYAVCSMERGSMGIITFYLSIDLSNRSKITFHQKTCQLSSRKRESKTRRLEAERQSNMNSSSLSLSLLFSSLLPSFFLFSLSYQIKAVILVFSLSIISRFTQNKLCVTHILTCFDSCFCVACCSLVVGS